MAHNAQKVIYTGGCAWRGEGIKGENREATGQSSANEPGSLLSCKVAEIILNVLSWCNNDNECSFNCFISMLHNKTWAFLLLKDGMILV